MHLFDQGWEKLRETIFANQKRLGVIPANTELTPWPDGQPEFGGAKLAKWDTLSPDEKKLFIRQADVFAAYTAYTDHEIGRVIEEIKPRASSTTHSSSSPAATTAPVPKGPPSAPRSIWPRSKASASRSRTS